MVPPGWTSLLGAVAGGAVTLVMPPVSDLLPTALVRLLFFVVVLVVFLAVVDGPPLPATVVEVAAPASPATAVVEVDSSGVVVTPSGLVAAVLDLLLLPPPHAARASPAASAIVRSRRFVVMVSSYPSTLGKSRTVADRGGNMPISLDEYAGRYEHVAMERRDGVLQLTLHSDSDSLRWGPEPHDELWQVFRD